MTAWQLVTWALAQAANRAGRTGRYLQRWETEPECDAVTSAPQIPYNAWLGQGRPDCFRIVSALVPHSFCMLTFFNAGLTKLAGPGRYAYAGLAILGLARSGGIVSAWFPHSFRMASACLLSAL